MLWLAGLGPLPPALCLFIFSFGSGCVWLWPFLLSLLNKHIIIKCAESASFSYWPLFVGVFVSV